MLRRDERVDRRPRRLWRAGVVRSWGRALLAFVVTAATFGFLLRHLGVHLTPDSVEYVAMARSLAAGEGVRGFDGRWSGIWTPGYAWVLAPFVGARGENAAILARVPWVHAALWAAVLVGAMVPLARAVRSRAWALALLAAAAFGAPVLTVASSLLADVLLVVCVTTTLVLAERVVRRSSRRVVVVMCAVAALAPLVKVVGLMVWPAVAWVGVQTWWRGGRGPRRSAILLAASIAVVAPFAAWVLRNVAEYGAAFERFPGDPLPGGPVVRRTLEHVARWFVPQFDSTDVLLICSVGLAIGALVVWRRRGGRGPHAVDVPWILAAGSFFLMLWGGSALQRVDLPNARLLAPLYLVGAVLFVRAGDALGARCGRPKVGALFAFAWTAWTLVSGATAVRSHLFEDRAGVYRPDGEIAVALDELVAGLDPSTALWSNVPEYLYWHTGRRAQWTSPARWSEFDAAAPTPVALVWFSDSARRGLLDAAALSAWIRWSRSVGTGPVVLHEGTLVESPQLPDPTSAGI